MNFRTWLSVLLLIFSAAPSLAADAQGSAEYRLGDGDNIRITVFQNPDLTLETRVSEDGTIGYPLVGTVKIGGMTIANASQTIADALRAGNYIQKPQVNIQLIKNLGNQVSVMGQVGRPGRYPLETFNTRLSELLAMAGGISPTGSDVAIVSGTRNGKAFWKEVDIARMFLERKLEDDLVVAGGDVIFVDRQPMFYIYGEVQKSGSYRVERGMTVRQALAQGGGLTQRGTERDLAVYRRKPDGTVDKTPLDLSELVLPNDVLQVRVSLF